MPESPTDDLNIDSDRVFDEGESIYELEPFVLPGESQDRLHISADASELGIARLKSQMTSAPLFTKDQESTIPPGEAHMLEEYNKRLALKASAAQLDQLIGISIAGKYEIFDIVGKGNMASVYKARQYSTGNTVAVKTCRLGADEVEMTRFEREIATHSKLSHPNIVEFIDLAQDGDGRKFLVMELIRGISLQEILEIHGPIEQPENIWSIIHQACNALDHAHNRGVIHRDLKSANVILSKSSDEGIHVKILDFGISKTTEFMQKITQDGFVVGTPYYMSPEQCQGEELSASADIYSLGILAFEMITGFFPYHYDAPIDLMRAHCNPMIMPEPLSKAVPHMPAVKLLGDIILKAIATFPESRFASAVQFRKSVDYWISVVRSGLRD
jgi:serine/threonine-protein kinase